MLSHLFFSCCYKRLPTHSGGRLFYPKFSPELQLRGGDMKKSCPYCGRIHDKKFICPKKPKPLPKERTEIVRFRSSLQWQKMRDFIVKRDHFLCKICLKNGIFTSGDLQVHHIIPLAADFSKRCDPDNLITLCPKCHEAAERGDFPVSELIALTSESTPLP